jgi:type VI secretion system protein ImpA
MSLQEWLAESKDAPPCGPALDFDADFLALEQLLLGKPERQYGDTIIPAEQPDWRSVRSIAGALIAKSKDLRVAVSLLRGGIQSSGVEGMVEPLELIRHMLDQWWDQVHPRLEVDGEVDPYMRSNATSLLSDRDGFLRELRSVTFLESRGIRVLIKDAELALGTQDVGSDFAITRDQLRGLIAEALELNPDAFNSINTCGALLVEINRICQEKFEQQNAPDLVGVLRLFSSFTAAITSARQALTAAEISENASDQLPNGENGSPFSIKNRTDAIRSIDAICRYFEQNEPASPAPIFLRRAKKLVGMSFLDIIKDMAPDSLPRIGIISGESNES